MKTKNQRPDPDLAQAIQALKSGNPELTEQICRAHLSTHPASVEHMLLLGHAPQNQEKLDEATNLLGWF